MRGEKRKVAELRNTNKSRHLSIPPAIATSPAAQPASSVLAASLTQPTHAALSNTFYKNKHGLDSFKKCSLSSLAGIRAGSVCTSRFL